MAQFTTNIQAKNMELTGDIRTLVNDKISHFEKFLPVADSEEVLVDVEVGKTTEHHSHGKIFRAEFNLSYKGQFRRAESTQEDLRAAIEIASDDMVRQIRRNKERTIERIRKGASKLKGWLRFGRGKE